MAPSANFPSVFTPKVSALKLGEQRNGTFAEGGKPQPNYLYSVFNAIKSD
jgi:hypothetical protein